jgi:hypothetical protein
MRVSTMHQLTMPSSRDMKLSESKASKVGHRADSPDGAPRDSFLSGHLKREMVGFTVRTPKDTLSEIRWILEDILNDTLTALSNNWISSR